MLKIFNKGTTSFSSLGLGVLKDLTSDAKINEELNGCYELTFNYAKNGINADYLVIENIVVCNNQPFQIWSVEKTDNEIQVYCKHLIIAKLTKNFLEDVYPQNLTGVNALNWILARTKETHSITCSGDCSNVSSARYVRKNVIDAIYNEDNALLTRFGGELEYNGLNIVYHQQRGSNLGLEIRENKNVTGIDISIDMTDVATRIMPVGSNELLLTNKYVDSPLLSNYSCPLVATVDVDTDTDDTEENQRQAMTNYVNSLYANGVDKPTISVKVDFVELSKTTEYQRYSNLESAHLGDTVKVYIPSFNLTMTTRIVKTTYNDNLGRITQLELGSVKQDIASFNVENNKKTMNALAQVNPTTLLSQANENASNLLKQPFNGYIYIDETTGQMFLMDTNDIATATKIWRFGLNGIGYSSTGLNGSYGIAITSDGSINADYITTGTIAVERIESLNQLITQVTNLDTSSNNSSNEIEVIKDTLNTINTTMLNQTANQFEMLFANTNTQQTLDELQSIVNTQGSTIETLRAYIRYGVIEDSESPYYGSPYIELGKDSSSSKLRILDSRIQFLTGTTENAYISNNTLYITESTILVKMQIGNWIDQKDSNGNLNLKWGGD